MAISYDEYINKNKKKKKKEEPKVVLGYSKNQNNVSNTPKSTTNTQSLIDKYIAEQKAKGDIAPIKTTTPKKKDERTWFQAGAFKDGYQVGDVTKTILGTGADIGLGITKGVLNMGEGIVDLGKYGVSGAANLLGAKKFAKNVKKSAQENSVDKFFSPLEKKIDKNSIIGEKGDTISEGLGYVGGMIATGGLGGAIGGAVGGTAKAIQLGATLGTTGTTFTSAMGSGMSQAYQDGATDEEAVTYGVISGLAEAGTELIFGGLGKTINAVGLNTGLSSADDMLAKKISGIFKNQIAKNIASTGVKMTAEGSEEVIAGVIQAFGQKLTYMSEEDIMKLIDDQELLESFISGAVVSGIAQSPSVIKDTKAGKDYITGYTQTEQEAIDKLTNERIVEQEREGITLTKKEKANIEAQVKEDLQAGKIKATEIDDIAPIYEDSALTNEKRGGGQADIREEEIALQEEAPVQEDSNVEGYVDPELTPIGTTVETDETVLRSQNYVYQASETDSEYRRNLNEDATKYANNTTRTHEFVNTLANVSEASGLDIRLTNNTSPEMTQRKEAMINSYAKRNNVSVQEASERLKNIVIDGYNVNDQITINVNSPKALNRLVGHEITHSLEKTGEYKNNLQKLAIEYAKSKNDYKSRLDRLMDLYAGQNADINKELTADIIGDYLFTDQKFVDSIYKKDRNLFQRIYDEIKHLIKMATAGSKEARELEKLKHSFEKAMQENKEMSKESSNTTTQESKSNSLVEAESNTQEKEDSVQKTEKAETSNVTESVEAETKTEDKAEEYSLSNVDSKGRELTEEQIEFFEDTVIRDENGNLLVMYHGTRGEFYTFDLGKAGQNYEGGWSMSGRGFYFASDFKEAKEYAGASVNDGDIIIKEVYLNMTNPFYTFENYTEELAHIKEKYNIDDLSLKAGYRLIDVLNQHGFDSTTVLKELGFDGVIEGARNDKIDQVMVFDSNQIKDIDNKKPTEDSDIRYSLSDKTDAEVREALLDTRNDISERALKNMREYIAEQRPNLFNEGTDNLGRKLSKGMKNFMKDSKVRDVNDSLTTVYHTINHETVQFNEFNPVGTPGYKFGEQVVNFFTNSKVMSGSYANQRYEMADTKKLNNLEEVNQWLETQDVRPVLDIDNLPEPTTDNEKRLYEMLQEFREGKKYIVVSKDASRVIGFFKNEKDLIRNVKAEVMSMHVSQAKKFQYEGYINITNPYVIDAEGRSWGAVSRSLDTDKINKLENLSQSKKTELIELAQESKDLYDIFIGSGKNRQYHSMREAIQSQLSEMEQYHVMLGLALDNPGQLITYWQGNSQITDNLERFVKEYKELEDVYKKEGVSPRAYFDTKYSEVITKDSSIYGIDRADVYEVARDGFENINEKFTKNLETNDVVKQVIEMNKNGSNYDGVIFKDVIDYGGDSNGDPSPSDVYVTFNSNQFKAWDNENPTDDPDIRYSLSVNDYGMSHRPSTDYGDGSNFEENMPDVFEHPEWYFFGSDARSKKAYRESLEALRKVRNNPEGEITIYRATIGDSINEGDWVTPSKTYAEWHNDSQFDGKANIIELKVKAKDIRFAGDDLNEFGYFPNGTDNFSLSRTDDVAPVGENDIFGSDIAVQEQVKEAIAPLQEQIETLTKTISDLQENMAPASFDLAEEQRAETQRTMTDEDAPLTDEGTFSFLDEEVKVKKKNEIIKDIQSDFNIKQSEARELYNKIDSIPEVTIDDVYTELENYRKVKFKEQDDYIKSIQDYIKGTRLDISEIKKQIPDYGNVYRMANMGKGLILGNSGQSIDSFYQELNELYPNEFPSEVTAEADQLELISQAMFKEKELTYTDVLDDDELQILAERIYADIGNSERYRHTQSGLYFLNQEVKKMAPPGEINTNISEEEYADSLPTLNASNTEQIEENVSLDEELNELDRQKGPSITKNPFDEVLDKFLEGKRTQKIAAVTPKVEKSKYRNAVDTAQRLFVNEMVESDNLAKETGNLNIKYTGDMLNNVAGEIEGEIYTAQTDNEGHQIGKSLSALFSEARKTGLYDAFNDYLEQYSNIDRHAQGKGSVVPLADSQRLVSHYEKTYPEFKQWGKGVWQYGANIRNNLIDAGIINEEFAETLGTMYPHYVPYMENREMSNYNPDLGEIKPKGVIKRAKGGADNLLPIEDALTKYTFAFKKAVRQNQFYQEIVSTLDTKAEVGADVRNDAVDLEDTLYKDETGNYLTAYFDGERLSVRISDDLYTGLKNDLEGQIRGLEEKFALITDPVQKLSEIRRNLLTSWNPMFIIKNPIMDVQDALFNSKHTKDFMKNYPGAFVELGQAKSETAKQFLTLYGSGNVMGEYSSDGTVKNRNFLKGIQKANNIMELAPRYAEFKASLENGATLEEAMYNAREVTTNFGRGGVITKALNRNGFTFLNVSVQGFDKFIRNFSGENGAKGVAGALLKASVLGVIPAIFNELAFGSGDEEDEDYNALPDYIKDNYYLIKTGDGEFIRIPKGRMLSVFGSAARRTIEYMQGEEDAFDGFLKNANSQIGVSNPLDSNILTPLFQAFGSENGEAWYGGDLVPTRLQGKAPREQYDSSTDKFSIWLGDKLGISPYKINYVIDQYSGGVGDIFLPFFTEESTSDAEGLELALAPIKDQFTANSTFDNKYAGDIYDLSDKMDKMPSSVKETDEYKIQDAYLYSVTSEMGKLYAERRKVQEDKTLSKKEKYEKVQKIQKQINDLAKEGLDNYQNINSTKNYAIVGGREFNKYKTESGEERWGAVREEELEALNSYGLDIMEKSSYFNAKTYISEAQEKYKNTEDYTQKKRDIISVIKSTLLTDEAKAYLYDKYYGDTETLNAVTTLGIDFDKYLDFEYQNFEADKNSAGKSISGSKKAKVFAYINSMDLSFEEKVVLTKLQYNSYDEYNGEVINYINNSALTYEQRVNILKKLGFTVDEYGNIYW